MSSVPTTDDRDGNATGSASSHSNSFSSETRDEECGEFQSELQDFTWNRRLPAAAADIPENLHNPSSASVVSVSYCLSVL